MTVRVPQHHRGQTLYLSPGCGIPPLPLPPLKKSPITSSTNLKEKSLFLRSVNWMSVILHSQAVYNRRGAKVKRPLTSTYLTSTLIFSSGGFPLWGLRTQVVFSGAFTGRVFGQKGVRGDPFKRIKSWKAANGGAKRIVRFWGGKTYHRVRPPKPVLEASESGICLVCAGFL